MATQVPASPASSDAAPAAPVDQSAAPAPQQPNDGTITIKTQKFFDIGFGKFLENSNYYDVVLHHVPANIEYKSHRIILSLKSAFFDALFSSRFMESKREKVAVHFEDPDNVFPKVIEYFYKGETKLDSQHVVSLRVLADQLMCPDLSDTVLTYLDSNLSHRNVFHILFKALAAQDDLVLEKAVAYVAKEFLNLNEEFARRLNEFPPHVFFNIIAHENLGKGGSSDASKDRNKLVSTLAKDYIEKKQIMRDISLFSDAIDALVASNTLNANDALVFLIECEKLGLTSQAAGCARVLASTFYSMSDNNFVFNLKPSSFIQLICSDELFVKSEDQVYSLAFEYITKNPQISEQEKRDIMLSVRYSFLSLSKLKEIRNGKVPYISKKDIADLLLYRISRIEGVDMFKGAAVPAAMRPRTTRVFHYQSDFDTNGILYWLGTNYGSESTYRNPLDAGFIDVHTSANFEAGTKQNLVGRDAASCNLVNQPNNHVIIEFKKIAVLPTKYTIRHTNARDNECLRNWKFQASTDGKVYVDLKDHQNDAALNAKGASASWDLEGEKTNEYYSFFKIWQTGNNSSNNGYLSMSGFEIYGFVRKFDTSGAAEDL